jgi:hypothetical protein
MEKRVIIIKKHKGIGDTVAAITKATGLDKLVGKDCGCPERQEAWNDPELLVNRVFYGTKQDIEVLRDSPGRSRAEEGESKKN